MATKPEMRKVILEHVFKSNFARQLKHVISDMEDLREEKSELIKRRKSYPKKERKRYKNILKDINHRLHKLDLEKRQFSSEGSGVRGDPEPTEKIVEDIDYSFKSEKRKKKGSGDKRRNLNKVLNAKIMKRRKKRGW